jgi:hypothetical protein
MKKIGLLKSGLIGFAVPFLIFESCSKDKTQAPNETFCDSTKTFTYTADVKPIFDANCALIGCHNTIGAAAGVVLDDFTSAKTFTESGKVICAMKYSSGCTPMPASGKLADSLIQKVECWAKTGFAN